MGLCGLIETGILPPGGVCCQLGSWRSGALWENPVYDIVGKWSGSQSTVHLVFVFVTS